MTDPFAGTPFTPPVTGRYVRDNTQQVAVTCLECGNTTTAWNYNRAHGRELVTHVWVCEPCER